MEKGVILRLVGIIIALSLSHTRANPAGYTRSYKESEPPNHAPLDDEDDNSFSGDLGMFSSSLTHKDETGKFDLNLSKNMEEVTLYLTDESTSMNLKNVSGMNEFDQGDNLPLGLQESYYGNFYEDDGGDGCEVLKSLGIHCEPGSESPTEEETEGDTDEKHTTSETIVATLPVITAKPSAPFQEHTSTTATEKPFRTTPTKTEQSLATTTFSADISTNKNQEKADENKMHTTISAIAFTATSTATGEDILDATSIGATTTSEKEDKTQGLPSDATEDEDLDVVIPELIPVTSNTTRVTVATNTAESITTPESDVVEEVVIPVEPDRSTQRSTLKTTMSYIGEVTNTFPVTETTTSKSGSITNAAENVVTSEGNKLETTTTAPSSSTSTTKRQEKPVLTTSRKQSSKSTSNSAPPPDDDTPTTVYALKTVTTKSVTLKTVKMEDDVTPQTQALTNSTPQPTIGTKTVTEAPVDDGKDKMTETVKTNGQDDNAQQPFTSPESDKAKEDARTDSIAPQQAKLSTIVLIVCIISLLIVLILVIVIIVIVRARLKRRGKYAITSEIDSTEGGAPGGQAGKSDVAQGSGEKVVTVQYNDSNA